MSSGPLAILRGQPLSAEELARRSCAWATAASSGAVLTIARPTDDATIAGAFQRSTELPDAAPARRLRRGSGGATALVGPGTVWLELALARPDALVPCSPDKIINRLVRPLLRALTRATGVPASYFGRDWVSAAHRPVALVSFAHEASTGRCLFEAIVAVSSPFAPCERSSFLGRAPATLEEVSGRSLDPEVVIDRIAAAYGDAASEVRALDPAAAALSDASEAVVGIDPPWLATREEAIGIVAAGRDAASRIVVGGELVASRDAVARLADLVAALPPGASADDVGRAVDAALTAPGVVTFGVRSFASIRDVIVDAQNIA